MFKLLGAIGRFFRAILYTFAGDVSKWSEVWETSPSYIHAEYDDIEKGQKRSIGDTTDAVAQLLEVVSRKESTLERLTAEATELKQKQKGALNMAQGQMQKLKTAGKTDTQIKLDETVVKCLHYYDNFDTTIKAKEEEASRLEKELEKHHSDVAKYKSKLQIMHTELQKIKSERAETVADIEIAKQEKKVNDALLGLSDSGVDERRNRIQELRRKARSKADITSEMAGITQGDAEKEFLDYAAKTETESSFYNMLGLKEEQKLSPAPETAEAPATEQTKLPE
jgi:chromosome segregation ATPase